VDGLDEGETSLEMVKSNDYGESWRWFCVSRALS